MADTLIRNEAAVLAVNLWGGDDTGYRVLDNRMVVTRVRHDCAICFEAIPPGARVRASREVYDGTAMTFRVCPTCCAAAIADPDGVAWMARFDMGRANSEKKREL